MPEHNGRHFQDSLINFHEWKTDVFWLEFHEMASAPDVQHEVVIRIMMISHISHRRISGHKGPLLLTGIDFDTSMNM